MHCTHPIFIYLIDGTLAATECLCLIECLLRFTSVQPLPVHPPGTFFEPIKGVSRVHIPDQFVWTDWTDIESLGVLEIFMQWIEHAAGDVFKGINFHLKPEPKLEPNCR